jgi:3-methyl-2-oxobutanoate hydroxymethyltransferase
VSGEKIAMVTAYDFTMARLVAEAGVGMVRVGDSLGMVVQGHPNSLPVTLDDVVYHTRCVARAVRRALLIADLPFMSYQVSPEQAVANAGRLIQEGGAHAVKLEGGVRMARAVEEITRADIPVMGHIGLTPQSVRRLGGFRVQRDEGHILDDAKAIVDAGAIALVLECIPAEIAAKVTASIPIPTIGIGAGAGCDGQVLVLPDMLGMFDDLRPKFVKRYAELGEAIRAAVRQYCSEVQSGQFPAEEHRFR